MYDVSFLTMFGWENLKITVSWKQYYRDYQLYNIFYSSVFGCSFDIPCD